MINIIDVSKTYKGKKKKADVKAIRHIDLIINDKECVAITGKSGSGKSTLMKIIGTIDVPEHGKIYINEVDVLNMNEDQKANFRNNTIGYVFQDFLLENSLTIEENVELPLMIQKVKKAERKKRVEEMLRLVGVEDRIGHKPTELSGGEKQRVSIARALITNPDILLADEPTGNLDEATGNEIYNLMRKLTYGKIMIMVTHDKELALKADRMIVLRDGQIV